jgi:mRNA interferase MazF
VTLRLAVRLLRGEVWWVSFDPSLGGEVQKTRPAVIVSNNSSNRLLNRLQVVPITSRTERVYLCEAIVVLNGAPRKAMADQLTTVSKSRLGDKIGELAGSDLQSIERAIRVQLGLAGPRT